MAMHGFNIWSKSLNCRAVFALEAYFYNESSNAYDVAGGACGGDSASTWDMGAATATGWGAGVDVGAIGADVGLVAGDVAIVLMDILARRKGHLGGF
jgi:hypothetical protein